MCIRDRDDGPAGGLVDPRQAIDRLAEDLRERGHAVVQHRPVSYTHLRAHETVLDLVCRLLLEKKKTTNTSQNLSYMGQIESEYLTTRRHMN